MSREELKTYLQITATTDFDADVDDALASATEEINNHTGRQFNRDDVIFSTNTETQVFVTRFSDLAIVADFFTTEDLLIETDPVGDGSFSTTLNAADYQLEPLNGIRDGNRGWPFFKIRAKGSTAFPTGPFPGIRVTAHFGWEAVPAGVKSACRMLAAETFKMREAPFGVAGWSEFGAVRVRDIPKVQKLLYPHELQRVKVRGG